MAVPKRKTSKSRVRSRKQSHAVQSAKPAVCAECGEPHLPHRVCPKCGYYRGRQVLSVEAD